MLNFTNPVVGIHFVHYIEQKDCTDGLDAGERFRIQVYSSYTGRTVQRRAVLAVLYLWFPTSVPSNNASTV